jgi:hypothetical protein
MNKILYNNLEIPSPTPYVTFEREHKYLGKKIGNENKIILKGQLTGNFDQLISGQKNLINIFSKNFGIFKILENNSIIFEQSGIVIDDMSFEDSKYNGIIDYNINLVSKSMNYNVLEPENSFEFSEEDNNILSLTHAISAKGLNTNNSTSNALDNAIGFVKNLSGLKNLPQTKFLNQKNNNFYLKNQSEKIDRLNNKYSIEETYVNDLSYSQANNSIRRCTIEIESGTNNEFVSLRLNGEINGSATGDMNLIRYDLNPIFLINDYINQYNINQTPLSYNIDENPSEKTIKFSYEFDNCPYPNPYVTSSISCQEDVIEQIVRINLNMRVKVRGNLNTRKNLLNSFSVGSYASEAFATYRNMLDRNEIAGNGGFRVARSQSKTDLNNSEMIIDIEYDNKNIFGGGMFYDSTLEITQVLPQAIVIPEAACNVYGKYAFVDLGTVSSQRSQVSFNGELLGTVSEEEVAGFLSESLSVFCYPSSRATKNISMSQGIDGGTRKSVSYSCNSINPSASSYLPVINF